MVRRGKRHRYQEARLLKRGEFPGTRRCEECGAVGEHASWCEAEPVAVLDDDESAPFSDLDDADEA